MGGLVSANILKAFYGHCEISRSPVDSSKHNTTVRSPLFAFVTAARDRLSDCRLAAG